DVRVIIHLLQQGLDGDAFPVGIELGPFGDTADVDSWRLMRKGQQFLPGPPLWLFHVPYNREIPPFQVSVRGWAGRKHRETALKILYCPGGSRPATSPCWRRPLKARETNPSLIFTPPDLLSLISLLS